MKNGSRKSDDPIIMAETGKHHSNDRARNCLSPGCAASKSQLKLQRNRSDHIFSHFSRTFCRSERREEDTSVSIYGLGGLGSASLVSIPSVHFRSLFLLHVNCFRIWHPDFPQIPYPAGSLPPSLDRRSLSLSPLSLTVDSPDSRLSIPVSLSPSSVITRLLPAPLSPRSLRNSRLVQWLNLTATALERPERSQQSFFPPCPAGRKASWPYRSPPQPNALVSLRTLHEKA